MFKTGKFLFSVILLLCAAYAPTVLCSLTADPYGISTTLEAEESAEYELYLENNGNNEITYNLSILPGIIEDNRLKWPPGRDDRGGPDDAGYEWRDNDEEDCPAYEWIDIREFDGVVDIENLQDDASAGEFDFEFEVEYYGNTFDHITIFPNGMAVLGDDPGNIQYFYPIGQWNEDLPSSAGDPPPPPNLLCVSYQDLNPAVSGHIYFWSDERMAVCTWQDVPHFQDANAENELWTFQVVIFSNGLFKYQYANIGMYDDADIMIGFQNQDQDMGFTCMRNDFDYLDAEDVVAFGPEGVWITWVTVDPASGTIESNSDDVIVVAFNTEDMEQGYYYADLEISYRDPELDEMIFMRMPLVMSLESPVGNVEITVTDAATEEAIANVDVALNPYGMQRTSGGDGSCEMTDIPLGFYNFTCELTDYLPYISEDVEVTDGETSEVTLALLHAECNPTVDEINEELPLDSQVDVEFSVNNDGNGALTYRAETWLAGGEPAEPWETRMIYSAGENCQDSRLEGVVFDGTNFYIAGSNNWDDDLENMIHIMNRDGEKIGEFEQAGQSRYGFRDLAWDGELIWGSGESTIFGFDRDGNVQNSFAGPFRSQQGLAWDPDNEYLWVCDITSNIAGVDLEGTQRRELVADGLRIYGLAYYPEDVDGYNLYVFHTVDETNLVHKMNTENGDTMFVHQLEPDMEGSAKGAIISNMFDIYSWVFISVINDARDDRLVISQLSSRTDWIALNPTEGVIPPGEGRDFTLSLSSVNWIPIELSATLKFFHDGIGGLNEIPVTLTVIDEPPPQPPSPFSLVEPVNEDTLASWEANTFHWERSYDPNPEDEVSYEIWFGFLEDSTSMQTMDTTLTLEPDAFDLPPEEDIFFTWWVNAISGEDVVECNERFTFMLDQPSGVGDGDDIPVEFTLRSVYPNPFNSRVTIDYGIDVDSPSSLGIYDLTGRKIKELLRETPAVGYHRLTWDASDLPSGEYLLMLVNQNRMQSRKVVLIK